MDSSRIPFWSIPGIIPLSIPEWLHFRGICDPQNGNFGLPLCHFKFLWIPVELGHSSGFRQESVGHDKDLQMSCIPKEHFYQGGAPQLETYVQIQNADLEDKASRVLIKLMQKVGVGNLQKALQRENFHLATDDADKDAQDQGFY